MTKLHNYDFFSLFLVVLHWDQRSCHLICAGDSRFIKIWDFETETKLTAISTGVNASVTALSMQSKGKNILNSWDIL